jgi:hypothetical protein
MPSPNFSPKNNSWFHLFPLLSLKSIKANWVRPCFPFNAMVYNELAYFLYDVNNGITIQDGDDSSGQQQYTKELLSEYETKHCSQNQTT